MIRQATEDDIDRIKTVASRYTKELGFIVRGALTDAISRGTLLVDPQTGSFCHYRTRIKDGVTVIYEICVPVEYRRRGIAKAMIEVLPRPIQLKCPIDNVSNDFYEYMGFTLVETVKGRKRRLNVWRLE